MTCPSCKGQLEHAVEPVCAHQLEGYDDEDAPRQRLEREMDQVCNWGKTQGDAQDRPGGKMSQVEAVGEGAQSPRDRTFKGADKTAPILSGRLVPPEPSAATRMRLPTESATSKSVSHLDSGVSLTYSAETAMTPKANPAARQLETATARTSETSVTELITRVSVDARTAPRRKHPQDADTPPTPTAGDWQDDRHPGNRQAARRPPQRLRASRSVRARRRTKHNYHSVATLHRSG